MCEILISFDTIVSASGLFGQMPLASDPRGAHVSIIDMINRYGPRSGTATTLGMDPTGPRFKSTSPSTA